MSESRLLDRFLKKAGQLERLWNSRTMEFEPQRTPTHFKSLNGVTASGSTALWTPISGKKFRLMGGVIGVSKEAACAGAETIALLDGSTVVFKADLSAAALVATGNQVFIPFSYAGNGYLAPVADTVLNLNLNGALTAGAAWANVWGCEE